MRNTPSILCSLPPRTCNDARCLRLTALCAASYSRFARCCFLSILLRVSRLFESYLEFEQFGEEV